MKFPWLPSQNARLHVEQKREVSVILANISSQMRHGSQAPGPELTPRIFFASSIAGSKGRRSTGSLLMSRF